MKNTASKKITIKDLALAMNVSQSTISKALTNKTGVGDEKREQIFKAAKSMGYEANRLAQGLARSEIKIGVISPSVWTDYYGLMRKGIEDAIKSLSDYRVEAVYKATSGMFSKKDIETSVDELIADEVDAVILCPASVTECNDALLKLKKEHIPVALLGTDLACDPSLRVAGVRVDSNKAGRLSAEIMDWLTPPDAVAAVFIGVKEISDHKEKAMGFGKVYTAAGKKICGIYETNDNPETAYTLACKLIQNVPDIKGIYVATANSIPVCAALADRGMKGKIKIVGTDKSGEITGYLKSGDISALIFQDPVKQGRIATEILYRYLINPKYDSGDILVEPTVILRNSII